MPRNNKDFSEGSGKEALDKTINAMGLGNRVIRDPFTNQDYLDLSDPKHPFHQPMFPDWDKKDGDK